MPNGVMRQPQSRAPPQAMAQLSQMYMKKLMESLTQQFGGNPANIPQIETQKARATAINLARENLARSAGQMQNPHMRMQGSPQSLAQYMAMQQQAGQAGGVPHAVQMTAAQQQQRHNLMMQSMAMQAQQQNGGQGLGIQQQGGVLSHDAQNMYQAQVSFI